MFAIGCLQIGRSWLMRFPPYVLLWDSPQGYTQGPGSLREMEKSALKALFPILAAATLFSLTIEGSK